MNKIKFICIVALLMSCTSIEAQNKSRINQQSTFDKFVTDFLSAFKSEQYGLMQKTVLYGENKKSLMDSEANMLKLQKALKNTNSKESDAMLTLLVQEGITTQFVSCAEDKYFKVNYLSKVPQQELKNFSGHQYFICRGGMMGGNKTIFLVGTRYKEKWYFIDLIILE